MYDGRVRLNSRTIYVQDLLTRVQWISMYVHGVRQTLVAKIFVEIPKIITSVDINPSFFEKVEVN